MKADTINWLAGTGQILANASILDTSPFAIDPYSKIVRNVLMPEDYDFAVLT